MDRNARFCELMTDFSGVFQETGPNHKSCLDLTYRIRVHYATNFRAPGRLDWAVLRGVAEYRGTQNRVFVAGGPTASWSIWRGSRRNTLCV